ncbi:MAG: carbamoyltransferase C-terminal domain-containing protein [Gammaproteobacteria bacterium]
MKVVLGLNVNPGHDTGAALLVERDGQLQVIAISQERLDRVKHSRAFPQQAINHCLQKADLRLRDVDLIVAPYLLNASPTDGASVYNDPDLNGKVSFFKMAEEIGIPVLFADHHLCHAASAYFATDWDDAVTLVIDGHGTSYETQSLFSCEGRQLTKLTSSNQPGLGWMYSATTEVLLGFDRLQEGKTMGLAGWTDYAGVHGAHFDASVENAGPLDTLYPQFMQTSTDGRWLLNAPVELPRRENGEDPTKPPFVQYAFAAQTELERGVLQLVEYARRINPDKRRLCFAGGVALNIPANRLIIESGLFEEVFIQPAATDPGLPLGAALLGYYTVLEGTVRWRMEHAFLAGEYSHKEVASVTSIWSGARSPYRAKDLARILDNDYLVAWFQGASEFGPRALGHRSILCCPRDRNMKAYLNREVKHREMFRPFAPIVPIERQGEFFDLTLSSPYMLINAAVNPEHAAKMPAVVHADGTARVQTIEQHINPDLHALLHAIGELNGVPVLLNTSLNLAGEPIVETPADALDLFTRAKLDVLVINGQILSKRPLIELMNTRNPGVKEFDLNAKFHQDKVEKPQHPAQQPVTSCRTEINAPQFVTVGNVAAVSQPASTIVAELDPFSRLEMVITQTPTMQSVEPAALQAFHQWCHENVKAGEVDVDPTKVIAETATRPLSQSLALAELLLATCHFDLAVKVGELLFGCHPMDHRVQDTLMRSRLYRQNGCVSRQPGQELLGNYCSHLWNTINVLPDGAVHQCCSVWLRTPISNVFHSTIDEAWHSATAEKVRESAINGDYRFCGKHACPHIQARMLGSVDADSMVKVWLDKPPALPVLPKRFNLAYDKTCNLSCPTCRTEQISAKGEELDRIETVTDGLMEALRQGERLEVTGSGDPFASKSFRRILQTVNREDFPNLKITIMTNGLLMRRSEWQKFEHLHGMIDCVSVSVDAAAAETYRIVRRGGEFADLLPSLEFIGELRRNEAIDYYRLNFVAQDLNFREMPAFVELARRVGADSVRFQMMHDWGTYQSEELRKRRVHLSDHPQHEEFVAVLKSLPKLHRPRIASDFGYLVDQPNIVNETGGVSGVQAVLPRLIERIRMAEVDSRPSDNYYVENFFPPEFYQQILAHLPDSDVYDFIEHPDAVLPDGTKTRKLLDLAPHTIAKMAPELRQFWTDFTRVLVSEELQNAILDKFADCLEDRFGCQRPPLVSVPILYRDFPGYRIGVHTDAPYKVATMMFYFPRDLSQRHLGTSFYFKTVNGFEIYKTNDFKPNSGFGFVRTETSWHGVEQLEMGESIRNTLALTIYVKGKEYRSDGGMM